MFDSKEWHKNYRKNNLKRISLEVQNDFYAIIKSHTEKTKESVNGFIKRAIAECIKNDTKKH